MRAHVAKLGNHLVVQLPVSYGRDMGLEEGSPVDLDVAGDRLTIRPVRYGVGDLLARLGISARRTEPADGGKAAQDLSPQGTERAKPEA